MTVGTVGTPDVAALAALALHVAVAAGTVGTALALAWLVRARGERAARESVYESGIVPRDLPRGRLDVPFFLIAAFFVIFDMEAAILFAWAIAVREAGVPGLIEAGVFIGVLLAALVYLWADGALDWAGGRATRGGNP